MLIKLDDHYKAYTNDFAEHNIEGTTVKECLSVLCNRYPQLLVNLQDNDGEMCKKSGITLNGEFLVEVDSPETPVTSTDTLVLTLDIPTGNSKFIGVIIGAVLVIVGAILTFVPGANLLGVALMEYGVTMIITSLIVGVVMTAFFTPSAPRMQEQGILYNSASYTFDGILNTTASGTAVQVVYGKHRVGGQVLNMYTTAEDTVEIINDVETTVNSSYLYAQIGLSEGEVESITDVHVNQLPLSYYDEVKSAPELDYIRLGKASQAIMPDFSKVMNTTSLGLKVRNTSTDLSQTPVVYTEYVPVKGYVYQLGKSGGWKYAVKLGIYDTNGYE